MTPAEFVESQQARGHRAAANLSFSNLTVRDEDSKTSWIDGDIIEFPATFSVKEGNVNVFDIPVGNQGKTTPAILVNIKTGDSVNRAGYWYPNMAQKCVDAVVNGKVGPRLRTEGSVHDWWI